MVMILASARIRPAALGLAGATCAAALAVAGTAPASAVTDARRPAAPPRPTIAVFHPTPASAISSDRQVALRIGSVAAGSGSVASVTIRIGAQRVQKVPVVKGRATYDVIVTGLTNGTRYAFSAVVCNTARKCTTSVATSFAPYGLPAPPTVTGTVEGSDITLHWGKVAMNSSPFELSVCSVFVQRSAEGDGSDEAADEALPAMDVDPAAEGSTSFSGAPGGSYVASYVCLVAGYKTVATRSAPISVDAA
jgi:hypothetical protein